jgi:hypothetical protein
VSFLGILIALGNVYKKPDLPSSSSTLQDTAEGMLRSVLVKIFEIAGSSIDHVPPVLYEFEISCSKKVDDRENVYSRVANMPSLINLSN